MLNSVPYLMAALLWITIPLVHFIVTRRLASQDNILLKDFPVVGLRNEWFCMSRATLRSVTKTAEWAAEGYSKYTKLNLPYLITTLDRGLLLILTPSHMKSVYRLSERRLDVFGTLQDQFHAMWTIRDDIIIRDPFHRYIIPRQLTRDLNRLTEPMVSEIEAGFKDSWGTETAWHEVNVWRSCFRIITQAVNSAYCSAPLCRNDKYIEALEGQSLAVFGGATLISITPALLRPLVGFFIRLWCIYYSKKIGNICAPEIRKRLGEVTTKGAGVDGDPKAVKDGLQIVIDETISKNDKSLLAIQLIADRLTIANDLTLFGTTYTVHHLLLSLASSDPSLKYIEALRDECTLALEYAGGLWTSGAVQELKLLDSAIRESMRVTSFSTVALARTVVDPNGIAISHKGSEVIIPQGTMLAVPVESIHNDENFYPDASQFKPFRFAGTEYQHTVSREDRATKPATTPDDHFLGFGTAKNPCPGRFLAVHIMKLMIAHILLNYDLKYSRAPFQPTNVLGVKAPRRDAVLVIRKRGQFA